MLVASENMKHLLDQGSFKSGVIYLRNLTGLTLDAWLLYGSGDKVPSDNTWAFNWNILASGNTELINCMIKRLNDCGIYNDKETAIKLTNYINLFWSNLGLDMDDVAHIINNYMNVFKAPRYRILFECVGTHGGYIKKTDYHATVFTLYHRDYFQYRYPCLYKRINGDFMKLYERRFNLVD